MHWNPNWSWNEWLNQAWSHSSVERITNHDRETIDCAYALWLKWNKETAKQVADILERRDDLLKGNENLFEEAKELLAK